MEPARGSDTGSTGGGSSALKKWGPLAALVAAAAVIAGVVLSGGGGDDPATDGADAAVVDDGGDGDGGDGDGGDGDSGDSADDSATDGDDGGTDDSGDDGDDGTDDSGDDGTDDSADEGAGSDGSAAADSGLRDGVITFSAAEEQGLDIEWGDRCDTETGQLRIPDFFAGECFAPFAGDNGGATAPGVTADTIRIVYWQSQQSDPVLNYITDAIVNDDTNADVADTLQKLVDYYGVYYETYGREVELIVFEGSGTINDAISARADAVKIAEELQPFMVWGGPTLTTAFADELAARNVPCLGCGPSQRHEYYTEAAPYLWTLGMGVQESSLMTTQFIGRQLAGDVAGFAGDESMRETERVFGRLWIEASEDSVLLNEEYEQNLSNEGVELAASVSYALDPATIQESAASAIAKLKEAGVTTVLFTGDPVAPRDFTREATAQGYFPEWVVAGTVLADTTVFARTYDQEQWANAISLSTLTTRVDPAIAGARFRYEWFYGEQPAASDTIGVLDPAPAQFFRVIQAVGPDLTIDGWSEVMFSTAATPRSITAPSISYGAQDRWPDGFEPSYNGIDDMTLLWWDPDLVGLDELDREAPGMYQYADGGKRFIYGEWPDGPPNVFDAATSVAVLEERPAEEPVPFYEPLPAP